jgi:dihydrofolate reductase
MRKVTYSMGVTLDGYIVGPDGRFDWSAPDDALFAMYVDELRETSVQLMGRRLYETMLYWETAEQNAELNDAEREWAQLWKALPKVVFSASLTEVEGNTELVSGGVADVIARWRAKPGDGDIAIGGANLAAEVARLDLIDEYRPTVYPVLLGGGRPYFPSAQQRVDLELVRTTPFSGGVTAYRYQVSR